MQNIFSGGQVVRQRLHTNTPRVHGKCLDFGSSTCNSSPCIHFYSKSNNNGGLGIRERLSQHNSLVINNSTTCRRFGKIIGTINSFLILNLLWKISHIHSQHNIFLLLVEELFSAV